MSKAMTMNDFSELTFDEMMTVDGGGWDEVLTAGSGGLLVANALPIAIVAGPAVGVAAVIGGGYLLYRAVSE